LIAWQTLFLIGFIDMTSPESVFKIMPYPPHELVREWHDTSKHAANSGTTFLCETLFAAKAAQWGQQQRDEEIQRWFQQNTSEDLLQHLQEQATCILNEMFAARELATELGNSPVIDPYLGQLLRLVETHIRMEDLRKASGEVSAE
jgi:uncharacterized protein with von Willebrand factor type A (vWA) domain